MEGDGGCRWFRQRTDRGASAHYDMHELLDQSGVLKVASTAWDIERRHTAKLARHLLVFGQCYSPKGLVYTAIRTAVQLKTGLVISEWWADPLKLS